MNKNLKEIEKLENKSCRTIGKLSIERNISYKEAEELYGNDFRIRAIAEMATSMDIDFKQAEKYHDLMCANVKLMIVRDSLAVLDNGLKQILKKIG